MMITPELRAPQQPQDKELFVRGLKVSVGGHALIAIAAIIAGLAFHREPVKYVPSIRVDLVALPDVKKSDQSLTDLSEKLSEASKGIKKTTEAEPVKPKEIITKPAPEPKEIDNSMALKKEKAKSRGKEDLKSAIDRIKALAAIESEVNKKGQNRSKTLAKGNQLSKGSAISGNVGNDMDAYIGSLQNRLRDNWNLPVWLSKQNLDAKVVVFLDKQGYVSHTVVSKSSGNKQFDDYTLKTIRMAQPFGPPPAEILDGGITLGFPL